MNGAFGSKASQTSVDNFQATVIGIDTKLIIGIQMAIQSLGSGGGISGACRWGSTTLIAFY